MTISKAKGVFLLAWVDAQGASADLLACGALKRLDPKTAEIKRMYVRPKARGHGLGRAVLNGLLDFGRGYGYRQLVLETGDL